MHATPAEPFNTAMQASSPFGDYHHCHPPHRAHLLHILPALPQLPPPLLDTTNGSGPHGISSYHTEWLPLNKIENLLIEELCYEDQAEFESALCGSFADFLTNLPHVTLKEQDGT